MRGLWVLRSPAGTIVRVKVKGQFRTIRPALYEHRQGMPPLRYLPDKEVYRDAARRFDF